MNRQMKFSTLILSLFCSAVLAAQTTQPAEEVAPVAEVLPPPVITLIDAGSEPRKELRYHPKVGTQSRINITMDMKLVKTIRGETGPEEKVPAIKFALSLNVIDVSDNGDVTYTFTYGNTKIEDDESNPSPLAGMIKQTYDSIEGLKGKVIMSNRGIPKSVTMEIPEDLHPFAKQQAENLKISFARMNMPLPEKAIGEGAKWKTVGPMKSADVELIQTATMTLDKMVGDELHISTELTQAAEPKDVNTPSASQMNMKSMYANGTGVSKFSLDDLAPISASLEIDTDTTTTFLMSGNEVEMTQRVELELGMTGGGG